MTPRTSGATWPMQPAAPIPGGLERNIRALTALNSMTQRPRNNQRTTSSNIRTLLSQNIQLVAHTPSPLLREEYLEVRRGVRRRLVEQRAHRLNLVKSRPVSSQPPKNKSTTRPPGTTVPWGPWWFCRLAEALRDVRLAEGEHQPVSPVKEGRRIDDIDDAEVIKAYLPQFRHVSVVEGEGSAG